MLKMLTTKNVGRFDRVLRLMPTLAVIWLWSAGLISGALGIALSVVAGALAVTALTGTCSIYYVLGLSTCKAKAQ
ncbi:MAG: DUF2892 domain-containing protein [Pseudomonadota bacterium]